MTSPVVTAIAPELIAIVKAAQAFVANLGADPTKLPVTAGPALGIFINTVALQGVPALNAEWALAQADATAKLNDLLTKLTTPAS